MVATQTEQLELQLLDEETWGERFGRARARSGLNLRDAATKISTVEPTSYATLARLERLDATPPDLRRRVVAALALLVYGYDPGQFGLSLDDLPRGIDRQALADLLIPTSCSLFESAA